MRNSQTTVFAVALVLITASSPTAGDDSTGQEAAIATIKELGGTVEVEE